MEIWNCFLLVMGRCKVCWNLKMRMRPDTDVASLRVIVGQMAHCGSDEYELQFIDTKKKFISVVL